MVVDREVFRVEHERRRVEVDPNALFEEQPIVGALGAVHHELVTLFADEELDGHPALRAAVVMA